jgi:hypothetical protein
MIARQGSQARCGLSRRYALLFGVILQPQIAARWAGSGLRGVGNHLSGLDLNQRFLLQLREMLELELTK